MIYHPPPKYKLTKEEQQIYRRIIDRHRKCIAEKYNFTKRQNNHIFQFKHRPKSRFYHENRQNMFANTILNKSRPESAKLTLTELQQIPAEEFLDLCEKLENMSISKKESNGSQNRMPRTNIRKNKSICQVALHRQREGPRNYESLEKSMKKLLPKISKFAPITNRQFFQLFMKKSNEAKKINTIKEQIQLEIEQENYLKVEAIMNARKTAKQFMIDRQLVENFRKAIMEVLEMGKKLSHIIAGSLPRLEQQIMQQSSNLPEQQKSQLFSIKNISLSRNIKKIQCFRQINGKIQQFNARIQEYYEGEMLISIPIRELRFFIDYFNTSIREIALQINHILTSICQQFFIPSEDVQVAQQFDLPNEATSITNAYAFNDFRQLHGDFMSYKHFIDMFYEHLERVLTLKDLMTSQNERKKSSTASNPKKLKAVIRIT